jgi:iron complex transport system substrate-binding protein
LDTAPGAAPGTVRHAAPGVVQARRVARLALALLLAITLATMLVGCAQGAAPDEPAAPQEAQAASTAITVTDMYDRTVTLAGPATQVVALTAADCEILYAIGAGSTLVGRGEYCDYPAEVLAVPAVESGMSTNIEQIIALKPQLVLMGSMAQDRAQVDQLEQAGIAVCVSGATDIAGTYTAIGLIGTLLGKEAAATAVIDEMKATFANLQAKATDKQAGSIYFEVQPLEFGLWAAGGNTFMDEVARMLGLTNIFGDLDGWVGVSEEQVLQRDPNFIVTVEMYIDGAQTPTEKVLSRTGWEDVAAIKDGAVLNLRDNELSRPGPRLAQGAQLLYDFVYGVS